MFVIMFGAVVFGWVLGRVVSGLAQGHQAPDVIMIGV